MATIPEAPVEHDNVPAVPGFWSYDQLTPEQVKWYYLRTPLSLKGVYEQDVLHRAHLQRFCNSDSLKLEAEYNRHQEELQRFWWEEQAELGARAAPKGATSAPLPEGEDSSATWQDYFHGHGAEDEAGLLVRGGLFEADLKQRRLKACYWPEESRRILRGTWFVEKSPDWVPLKEATADELEEAYRSEVWNPGKGRVQLQKSAAVQAARVELHTFTNEAKGWFALFASEDEIYLCKDDSLSWLSRKLSTATAAPGMRLRRGYQPPPEGVTVQEADPKTEEAEEAAAAQPVNKLLLVVHGIGQNLSGSNIAADAAAVRQNLRLLAVDQLSEPERMAGRIEVLPVQWRKHLNLDVDTMADVLMPPGVRSLRMMLHATAVEVLLYVTQLHCQDMLDSLVDSLNIQFHKFQRRNPGFAGEVSILAHSLGSVLCYDTLCNQPHLFEALQEKQQQQQLKPAAVGTAESPAEPLTLNPKPQPPPQASTELLPFSSKDLDPQRQSQDGDLITFGTQSTADDAVSGAVGASGIRSDLVDLSGLVSPTKPSMGASSELDALRQENQRLQRELQALRRSSSLGTSTSSPSRLGKTNPTQNPTTAAPEVSMAPPVAIKPLAFAVDRFIAAGSPLGIFLTLRRVNPSKGRGLGTPVAARLMLGAAHLHGDGLPAVERMYNLYHPFDPVGFRLEPLITVGAEKRRPVYAAYCRGGRRLHVGLAEFGEDVSAAMSAGAARASTIFQNSISSFKLASLSSSAKKPSTKEPAAEEGKLTEEEEAEEAGVQQASRGTDSAIWRLTEGQGDPLDAPTTSRSARGRLDFVLQSGNVENPWLSAMSSHFAYWASGDVGLFILRALHHQDVRLGGAPPGVPPQALAAPAAGNLKPLAGSSPAVKPGGADTPMSPTSPAANLNKGASPNGGVFSPMSTGGKSPREGVPRGLSDPEDWW